MENKRQRLELSAIAKSQMQTIGTSRSFSSVQKKAIKAITACRTPALGGHVQHCDKCGFDRPSYNSCRNRHCPKCQFVRKEQWVDRLKGNLPPVKYFHLVFTIPPCLHKLFYINQREAYSMLFQAAGNSILHLAGKVQYLGARIGAVGILHTWGQTLSYHPHIHMIVPAGGLSEDGSEWIASHAGFLVPVKVLSGVFRAMLWRKLQRAIEGDKIRLPDGESLESLKLSCYQKSWVVYSEKPFANTDGIIRYLGNYTHRVAISNHRLISHEEGKVSFTYKDYRDKGMEKVMQLDEQEFMRRFMQHILPEGFSKIRYYGILSLSQLQASLNSCVEALQKVTVLPRLQGLNGYEVCRLVTGSDPLCCPSCKVGIMRSRIKLKREPESSG
jgi:hypothetical protein